ncbi:GL22924 [Drosophila persimilis]|uniref:GL22924 n=1 Tax=Drosophila persimilis TaxID=7234 RepID=B4HC01_DROPE|nr:GL22924 [Drosophila persimilis]
MPTIIAKKRKSHQQPQLLVHQKKLDTIAALQVKEVIYAHTQAENTYQSQQQSHARHQQQHRTNAQPYSACITSKNQEFEAEKLDQKQLGTLEHFLRLSAMEYGVTGNPSAALNLSSICGKDPISESKLDLKESQELSMAQQVNLGADMEVVVAAGAKIVSNHDREP